MLSTWHRLADPFEGVFYPPMASLKSGRVDDKSCVMVKRITSRGVVCLCSWRNPNKSPRADAIRHQRSIHINRSKRQQTISRTSLNPKALLSATHQHAISIAPASTRILRLYHQDTTPCHIQLHTTHLSSQQWCVTASFIRANPPRIPPTSLSAI
jgi:hypothetical protein